MYETGQRETDTAALAQREGTRPPQASTSPRTTSNGSSINNRRKRDDSVLLYSNLLAMTEFPSCLLIESNVVTEFKPAGTISQKFVCRKKVAIEEKTLMPIADL